jgi:N-acetyl sugar amidotransferase
MSEAPGDYRICSFCVMDSSNPFIEFDAAGECTACRDARQRLPHEWWPGADGRARLDNLVATLKVAGAGRPYDAMIGLSGGVDSAYVAHTLVREYGLRLLAVHVDAGWNSAAAVGNIETLVRKLDLDLYTKVVEWAEVRDLQLAFLKASVLNQDIPQDHAFFATLYRTAEKFGISNFLSGVNFSSESVNLPNWGFPAIDGRHVRAIHKRFGTVPLRSFPIMSFMKFLWITRIRRHLNVWKPLNYMNYDKERALEMLVRNYRWRDYGGKHHESRFTKFYEQSYLPRRYKFDKRRLHFSSLIIANQLTRARALLMLESPVVDLVQERRDTQFVAKKLGISPAELRALMNRPPVLHEDYPHQLLLFNAVAYGRTLARAGSVKARFALRRVLRRR